MKDNGAIICFQKNTTEYRKKEIGDNEGPVCLGYFNHVEVRGIRTFRKYVHHASKYQASRACSRKQLLLRKREGLHEQIEISGMEAGAIPFRSSDPSEEFALGCCSVFNVRDGACRRSAVKENRCVTRAHLAKELYAQIQAIQRDGNFRFAVMESLGTEDLCLIVLTNHYDHISDVIKVVQSFGCKSGHPAAGCGSQCIIDNGHSILMFDRRCSLEADLWGATQASIHFSLRSAAGLHYLRAVERELNASRTLREGERVTLDGCSGEYDAIMRCPARLVMGTLFGDGGYFAPENSAYQQSVYQSETFVYPIGMDDTPDGPEELPPEESGQLKTELNRVVEDAIKELRTLFQYEEDDPDFDYIELPIWRLLKDYWSFASFPLNKDLKEDLKIQLIASVNAIVAEARKCVENRKIDDFQESYDKIVDALRASMQAGSQQDRWNFGEQQSYIQNVDSYYKILRCYYGMIKDMITLIYHIERSNGQDQPLLIPLLSFGVKSIIKSDSFASSVDGKPARLICIRLPYQAMANLPRYLGPLAHELFHYSAPAVRRSRNERMIKALIRVALTEFVCVLAGSRTGGDERDYWKKFYGFNEAWGDSFDLNKNVDQMFADLKAMLERIHKDIYTIKLDEIKEYILPECLYFSKSSENEKPFLFYYQMWKNLRAMVERYLADRQYKGVGGADRRLLREMFGLTASQKDGAKHNACHCPCRKRKAASSEERMRKCYQSIADRIDAASTDNFRKLLHNIFKAMEECPADIFNLEVVMARKDARQKVRQYLWQINGAKRDATLVRSFDKNKVDMWPFQDTEDSEDGYQNGTRRLLYNQIRNSMILRYYLGSGTQGDLRETLRDWCPETGRYSVSLGRVRQGFILDYEDVTARFQGLFTENSEICDAIATRIRRLLKNPQCKRIMCGLSEKYERYYRLLERRQRGQEADAEAVYQDGLFELCCDLIDAYQSQPALDVISVTSTPMERGYVN